MPSFFQPLNRAFFNARRRFNQIRYIHVPIYLEKRRLAHYTDAVIETLPGARPEEGKIFAIFVLFPTGDAIDESVLRALDALARHGVNILAMSNVKLGARARKSRTRSGALSIAAMSALISAPIRTASNISPPSGPTPGACC